MNAWVRALRAETLKLKHTLALWMVLLAPLAVACLVVLQFTVVAHHLAGHHASAAPAKAWRSLGRSMFGFWCLMMLPLFVTLETALLAELEHGNAQWKHLQALPLPRRVHFLGKWGMAVLMVLCSYLFLFALVPVAGWVLMYTGPALGIAGSPALASLAGPVAGSFAACLLITALQTWIALRWRSFTVVVSVGIVATVCGLLVSRSDTYGKFFPWSMPFQAFSETGHNAAIAIGIGMAGGLIVAALGLFDFLRRDCA
jgi:hypothetical protein